MKTLIFIAACVCGLAVAQRRLAKPIPLGFNPKYSAVSVQPQYSPKPYSAQYTPQPTPEAPAQYEPLANQQEYSEPNAVAYSTPAPFSPSAKPRVAYQPEEPRSKDYVTPIPIIRFDKEQSIDGSYRASYETGNNIIAEETGFLKNVGVKDQEALVQHGSYSYTSPDGTVITVTYTADEGGFRAEGAHLPTPPPVPEEIQKSIDLIYENIRLQQEAASKDPKLYKALQEQEEGFSSDNYPQNYR